MNASYEGLLQLTMIMIFQFSHSVVLGSVGYGGKSHIHRGMVGRLKLVASIIIGLKDGTNLFIHWCSKNMKLGILCSYYFSMGFASNRK